MSIVTVRARIELALSGGFGDQIISEHMTPAESVYRNRMLLDTRVLFTPSLEPRPGFMWAIQLLLQNPSADVAGLMRELSCQQAWPASIALSQARALFIRSYLFDFYLSGFMSKADMVQYINAHAAVESAPLFDSILSFCRRVEQSGAIAAGWA